MKATLENHNCQMCDKYAGTLYGTKKGWVCEKCMTKNDL